MNRLTGGQILGLKFITIKVPLTNHTRNLLPLALVNGRQHYTVQQLGHLLLRARDKGNSDALRPSTPLPLTMPAPAILNTTVQRACGPASVRSSECAGTKGCTLRRPATMRPARSRTAAHTAPRAVTTAIVTWRVLCGVRHAHTSRIAHVGRARVAK